MPHSKPKSLQEPCYLLRLPPEVRNIIWTLTCVPQDTEMKPLGRFGIIAYGKRHHWPRSLDFRRQQPAITRSCRQIRTEALPLHYSAGPFTVSDFPWDTSVEDLKAWSAAIGKSVHHIEAVTFQARPESSFYPTYRITIAVPRGQIEVRIGHDEVNYFWTMGEAFAEELRFTLPSCLFNRSVRLQKRAPRLVAHEWISVVNKVSDGLQLIDLERVGERFQRLKAERGRW